MAPRDYARLHWQWYRDRVIRAIAEIEPGIMSIWPVLIAMSKEQSNARTNPTGRVETTWNELGGYACVDPAAVERIMRMLEQDADMVEIENGVLELRVIQLRRFSDWQVPRASKAEQKQASRDFSIERGAVVATAGVSYTETETETEKVKPASSSVPADQVQAVFDYWLKVEKATGGYGSTGRTPKLTADRRTKITARLREGFSVAELKKAIAFYAKDPHHAGENDRGTRFTDLTTTLRTGSKVEAGVEGYERRGVPTAAGAVDDVTRMGY